MDEIARAIVDAAKPRRMRYATLRARGSDLDPNASTFHVRDVTGGSRQNFEDVVDAINYLHKNGFKRLDRAEEKRWVDLMNGGNNVVSRRPPPPNVTVAVFAKDADLRVQADAPLNARNMAVSVADAAERLAHRPHIVTINATPAPTTGDSIDFDVRGLDLNNDPSFRDVEDAIRTVFEAGFQRLDSGNEKKWKSLIEEANSLVGSDGSHFYLAGTVVGIFTI